jgi:hypothetical protein
MAPAALRRLFGGGAGRGKATAPHALQQLDPALPCPIAKLPNDLILYIFDLVQATSPQSSAKLALVHPRFYRQARYVQHRRLTVDLDNKHEAAAKHLDLIKKDVALLAAIHELHVLSCHGKPSAQCLERLTAMVI